MTSKRTLSHILVLAAIAAMLVLPAGAARAATLTWDNNGTGAGQTDGAGAWLGTGLWWDGATNVTWTPDANAIIGSGGAGGTITLGAVTAGTVLLNNFTGTYQLNGGSLAQSGGITVGPNAGNVSTTTAISGAGGITMNGSGLLNVRQSVLTYTGPTVVSNGGTMMFFNNLPTGSNFTLNNGMLTDYYRQTHIFANGLGTGAGQIQIYGNSGFGSGNGNGNWRIGAQNSVLKWGTVGEGATGFFNPTTLKLRSTFDNNGPGIWGQVTLQNRLDLNSGMRTIDVLVGSGNVGASWGKIDAGIQDTGAAGSLIKTGGGMLIIGTSTSTWGGNTTVSGGLLDFGATDENNIGGGSDRNISVAAGAGVRFDALSNAVLNRIVETTDEIVVMTGATANNLDFSSTGANLPGAFLGNYASNGAKMEYSGTITPASDAYRLGGKNSSGLLGIVGANKLTGTQGLIVGGTGASGIRVELAGENDFTGDTVINTGAKLTIGNNLALQNSVLNLGAAGGTFGLSTGTNSGRITGDVASPSPTFGGLTGSRNLYAAFTATGGNNETLLANTAVTGFTLNVGTGLTHTYSGAIGGFGTGAGTGGAAGTLGNSTLTKTGDGTQILQGINTYTGATTVSAGTLAIGAGGSINSSPTINLGGAGTYDVSGATGGYHLLGTQTLTGTGTVAGSLTADSGSIVAPGSGTLTFSSGPLTLATGAKVQVNNPGSSVIQLNGDYVDDLGAHTLLFPSTATTGDYTFLQWTGTTPAGMSGGTQGNWNVTQIGTTTSNWLGAVSNDWTDAASWDGITGTVTADTGAKALSLSLVQTGLVPAAGNDVIIDPTASGVTVTGPASPAVAVNNIQIAGTNNQSPTLTLGAANFNVTGAVNVLGNGTLNATAGALIVPTLNVSSSAAAATLGNASGAITTANVSAGTLTVNAGTVSTAVLTGTGSLAGTQAVTQVNVTAGTPSFSGKAATMTVTGGTVSFGANASAATLDLSNPGSGVADASAAPVAITGTLKLPGGVTGTFTGGTSFTAAGANLANTGIASTLSLSGGTLTFVTPSGSAAPTSGLLRHYTFDGVSTDVSGNNGIGTLAGGAALGTTGAKYGTGYLSLPNGNALLTIGTSASDGPHLGTSYTLTCWYQNSTDTGYRTLWRGLDNAPSGTGDHQVIVNTSTNNLGIFGNKSGGTFLQAGSATIPGGTTADNTWHFMAVVVDNTAGTQKFYTDSGASLSLLGTLSKTMADNYLAAFGNYLAGGQRFAQKLDDAWVYNVALGATDLANIMNDVRLIGGVNLPATSIAATDSSTLDLGAASWNHTLGNLSITNNLTQLTISGAAGLSLNSVTGDSGTDLLAGGVALSIASGNLASNITAASLTKVTGGTLTLTGSNTIAGATTVSAGTLDLGGGTASGSLASTILNLSGGTFAYTRTGGATESFTTTNIAGGTLAVSAGNILNLGTVAIAGGMIDFASTGAGTVAALEASNVNGIIPSATFGNTWAVAKGAGVAISGLAAYTLTSEALNDADNYTAANIDVDSSQTPDAAITLNSLRFNTAGAYALTLQGTNVITLGGILVTPTVGANLSTITGGTLAGAAGDSLTVIQNNTGAGLTIGSDIVDNTGATALIKAGAGELTLSGTNNSYTGATNVSAGTLSLDGSLTGGGAITVSGSAVLSESATGVISGAASITHSSTGASTLAGTNSYTGATIVSAGTLSLDGSLTGGGAITVSGSAVLWESATGVISGASSFTQGSSGTSILAGDNTYTGPTTITAGTLQLDGNTAAGSAVAIGTAGTLTGAGIAKGNATITGSGVIDFSGGRIAGTLGVTGGNWNGLGSVGGKTTVTSGVFTIGPDANMNVGDLVNNDRSFEVNGSSTVNVEGTLNVDEGSNVAVIQQGTLVVTGTVNTVGRWIPVGSGASAGVARIILEGSGQWNHTYAGNADFVIGEAGGARGELIIRDSAQLNSSFLAMARSGATTYGTVFQDGGTVTLNPTTAEYIEWQEPALELGYQGQAEYHLNGGVLNSGLIACVATFWGSTTGQGRFYFNGGTLKPNMDDPNSAVAAMVGQTSYMQNVTQVVVQAGGAVIDTDGHKITIAQKLEHDPAVGAPAIDGGLTKQGLGTLILNGPGASTYTGATTVSGGRLQLDGNSAAGALTTSSLTVGAGGTLGFTAGTTSTLDLTGKPFLLGGTVALDIEASGVNDALTVNDFTLTGNSVLTFNIIGAIANGATYTVLTSANPIVTNGFGITGPAGRFSLTPTINTNTVTVTWALDEAVWNQAGGGVWDTGGNWTGYKPAVAGDAALFGPAITAPAAITVDSAHSVGFMRFDNTNAYTIGTAGSGNLTLDNSASSALVVVNSGSHIIAENVALASSVAVVPASGATLTVSGNLSGAGGVLVCDAGSLVLSGVNTYTGATTLSAGTLEIGGSGQLGGGTYDGPIAIGTGATFKYNSDANQTLSGLISGGGNLIKDGVGTLTLSSTSTHTGPVTINQGTLKVGTFWNHPSAYSIASGAVLELNGNYLVPVGTTTINGTGTLRIAGGTLNVNQGGTNLAVSLGSGGLIDVQTGGGIVNNWHAMTWTSNLADLNVDGTFNVHDGHDVFVDALTGNGIVTRGHVKGPADPPVSTLTVGVDNGSGTFSGIIQLGTYSVPLELVKTGSGTQTLTGVNTYNGGTIVNAGTLAVSGAGSINGTTGITVDGPTAVFMQNSSVPSDRTFTLTQGTLGGTGTISTAITSGANVTIAPGDRTLATAEAGTLIIANAVDLTGGATEMRLFSATSSDSLLQSTTGGLTYGGILEIIDLNPTDFAVGNNWNLFDFESQSGTFSNDAEFGTVGGSDLPLLTAGQKWSFNYGTGVLSVVLGLIPGDTDLNSVVDAADFINLKKNFGAGPGASGGVTIGDFNASGTVNWADLNILTNNMGPGGDGAPATTPEPATLGLLAIGALAVLRRRRAA